MTTQSIIGIFGGSFDPPHASHLQLANSALHELKLDKIVFMPCYQHPLNKKLSSATHRLAMLKLLTQQQPYLDISNYEITQHHISYTLNTLRAWKQHHPNQRIIFLMGYDVLQHLNQWHAWEEIFNYCHLGVFPRPTTGQQQPAWLQILLEQRQQPSPEALLQQDNGGIYIFKTVLATISATKLRAQLSQNIIPPNSQIQQSICQYALENRLYEPKHH